MPVAGLARSLVSFAQTNLAVTLSNRLLRKMKVIIRVQSPQLKRLLRPARRRIERLPQFYLESEHSAKVPASPFAVWVSSIVTVAACLLVAMVASLEPKDLMSLGQVGQSLVHQVAAERHLDAPRPPEASFPYGSIPPLQSMEAPNSRPAVVAAQVP